MSGATSAATGNDKAFNDTAQNFRAIQANLTKLMNLRQNYTTKLNENMIVKDELDRLRDGNEVYKLIGPVLVETELTEAKMNVAKRIEFITNELKGLDKQIDESERKREESRQFLEQFEQQMAASHAKQQPQSQKA